MLIRYRNASIAFGAAVLLVAAVAPQFVMRSVVSAASGYPSAYLGYQFPRLFSLAEIVRNHSPLLLLLAVVGCTLVFRWPGAIRAAARCVSCFAAIWTVLWLSVVRQETTHYPHALPLMISLGLTALRLRLGELQATSRRIASGCFVLLGSVHTNKTVKC